MPIVQDLRYALRLLLKRPGFSTIAILTLALGIAATTSMFSVVEAVLLRPLPFPQPDRLVLVRIAGTEGADFPLPDADFLEWRSANQTADQVAVFQIETVNLTGIGEPERLGGATVSDRFFRVLDAAPEVGRVFQEGEDRPGQPRVAIISHSLWTRRFGGRADVIGRGITIAGVPATIVGVMPAGFAFPEASVDIWFLMQVESPRRRGPFYLTGLARLKEGLTIGQLQANLDSITRTLMRRYPAPEDWKLIAKPLHEASVGGVRRVLLVLLGTVGVLLVIATVNVASLLLARAAARDREIAVRGALGAAPRHLIGQLLVESVVLALCSGAVGLVLAIWATHGLLALAPEGLPRITEVRMNARVFLFAFVVAAIAGTLFGLAPALRARTTPLVDALKESGRGGGISGRQRRIQQALVIAEIALALVLSIGAGLMIRSLSALSQVSPGFEPSHLLTFRIALPQTAYDRQKTRTFFKTLLQRLEELPGVRGAALTISLPPNLLEMTDNFTVEGQQIPANQSAPVAPLLFVDQNYFRVLGAPLLRGRFFTERDDQDAPSAVIINQTLATRYFGNVDPVGRRLKIGGPERPTNPFITIVGVVGDIKYEGLDAPVNAAVYLPFLQATNTSQFVVVRTSGEPSALTAAVRRVVAGLDPDLPIARFESMEQLMAESLTPPRFRTTLMAVFAGVGLLLAAIGIYGVMAYAVSERTHELGIRLALGATPSDIARLVLVESAALAACGIAVGVAGAFAVTRLLAALLFGVTPTDVATFSAVAAVLAATALLASWMPMRRATKVDPMVALRYE
jgi:putative ABC transport system permease protein